jgi:uncharacterized protein with PIN domain
MDYSIDLAVDTSALVAVLFKGDDFSKTDIALVTINNPP